MVLHRFVYLHTVHRGSTKFNVQTDIDRSRLSGAIPVESEGFPRLRLHRCGLIYPESEHAQCNLEVCLRRAVATWMLTELWLPP